MTGLTFYARDAFTPTVNRLKALIQSRLDGPLDWVIYSDPPPLNQIRPLVILTDFERLDGATLGFARQLHDTLTHRGHRVLNDPSRVLYRRPLLDRLHEAGVNDFRAYDPHAPRDTWRWPVFLRQAHNHRGAVTDQLWSPVEVEAEIARLTQAGMADHLMATEVCDVRSADGLYRKYAAFKIGGSMFAAHIVFGATWSAKQDAVLTGELYDEEYRYVHDFPHRAAIERVFALANVDFGRVDYGVKDGRPQVWEINILPNPQDFSQKELLTCPAGPVYYDRLVAALNTEMAAAVSPSSLRPWAESRSPARRAS